MAEDEAVMETAAPSHHAFENGVQWRDLNVGKFLTIGSTVYVLECALFYPLDVVKTRQQAEQRSTHFRLWHDVIWRIVRQDGVRGLYRGFWMSAVGSLPSQAAYLLTYNLCKHRFHTLNDSLSSNPAATAHVAHLAAGAIADVVSNTLYVPIDVVVSRLQLQGASTQHYKNGLDAVRTIYAREGVRGLYTGYGITLLMYAPASALWWTCYEQFKEYFYTRNPRVLYHRLLASTTSPQSAHQPAPLNKTDERISQVLAGIGAGCITSLMTNPLDVVKTRMQTAMSPQNMIPSHARIAETHILQSAPHMSSSHTHPVPRTAAVPHVAASTSRPPTHPQAFAEGARGVFGRSEIVQNLASIVRKEGARALWRGLGPRLLYNVSFSGFSCLLYEQVLMWSKAAPSSP